MAQPTSKAEVAKRADAIEKKVIAWREDFHEHPELGNHEFRSSEIIAKHLESLGIEVKRGVATTGVVGILKGGKPGPVVALRADMDALPVTERTPVPFASKVTTTYMGNQVGVMHACGHDSHMAILMGVAEVLSSMKANSARHRKVYISTRRRGFTSRRERWCGANGKRGCVGKPES